MDHDEFARRAEALRARLYRTAYLYLGSEADALEAVDEGTLTLQTPITATAEALAVPEGRVFAVERRAQALALLERNKAALGLTNLHIVPGTAPEALTGLPTPDRVFLGGSSGNMEAILRCALSRNPQVRIVVTAVTLETVAEAIQCFARLGLSDTDMIQISATRTRKAGSYHLMDAQNPVWILSGEAAAAEVAVPSSADPITL